MAVSFHKKVLKKQRSYLIGTVNVSPMLIAGLYGDDAITRGEKQTIEAKSTMEDKVGELVDTLEMKTRTEYDVFLQSLVDAEQKHVRDALIAAERKLCQAAANQPPGRQLPRAANRDARPTGRSHAITVHDGSLQGNRATAAPIKPGSVASRICQTVPDASPENSLDLQMDISNPPEQERQAIMLDSVPYSVDPDNPGVVLIVNIKNFCDEFGNALPDRTRHGSRRDVVRIQDVFSRRHFKVYVHQDLTKVEIMRLTLDISRDPEMAMESSLIMVIMTHGEKEYFITADDQRMKLDSIVEYFDMRGCPALAGKPKMFVLQACRGDISNIGAHAPIPSPNDITNTEPSDDIVEDTEPSSFDPMQHLPLDTDMVFAYSTTSGYYAYRSESEGSWFISAFCDVLDQFAETEHVVDMLVRVNYEVSRCGSADRKQMPKPSITLRKKWYLLGEVRRHVQVTQ